MTADAQRANSLCEIGKFEEALVLLTRAAVDDPEDPRVWCVTAWAASSVGQPQRAIEAAERAIVADPHYEWSHRIYGLALGRAGRRREALEALNRALACDATEFRTWTLLAELHRALGKLSEAKHAARECVALAPAVANNWRVLGFTLEDEWDEAVAAYEEALRLNHDDAGSLNGLAWTHAKRGDLDVAADLVRRALQIRPGELYLLYNYAIITGLRNGVEAGSEAHRQALQYALALDETALRGAPNEAPAYWQRALHRRRATQRLEALDDARTAVRLAPQSPEAWRMLGWVAGSNERWRLARYGLRKSVELDPEDPHRWLEAAELAYLTERHAELRSWADRLASLGERNKWAPLGRAYLAAAEGDHGAARMEIEAYFSCNPFDCCYRRLHADCCLALGDEEGAAVSLEYAERRSPECHCSWTVRPGGTPRASRLR